MATEWPDLYIRSRLDDPGTVPRSAAGISASPDVIPFGIKQATDPVKFFTDNFNKALGVSVTANAPNFLYLRGRNQFDGDQTGKAYIYWAKYSLILFPAEWRNNLMETPNGKGYIDVAAKKGGVWVTPQPLVWDAPPKPNSAHCLIGRVSTTQHPNDIPDIDSIPNFAEWIAANGGLGWRNVSFVDAGFTFTTRQDYTQGETSEDMEVNVLCTGCPLGSEVYFTSDTVLPDGKPIELPLTMIAKSDGGTIIFGTGAFIPAGWKTTFSMVYKPNGGKPFPNFNLEMRVNYRPAQSQEKLFEMASTPEELGYEDMLMYHREKSSWLLAGEYHANVSKGAGIGPVRLIVVGACTSRIQPSG
jgi:hypothetical protein